MLADVGFYGRPTFPAIFSVANFPPWFNVASFFRIKVVKPFGTTKKTTETLQIWWSTFTSLGWIIQISADVLDWKTQLYDDSINFIVINGQTIRASMRSAKFESIDASVRMLTFCIVTRLSRLTTRFKVAFLGSSVSVGSKSYTNKLEKAILTFYKAGPHN